MRSDRAAVRQRLHRGVVDPGETVRTLSVHGGRLPEETTRFFGRTHEGAAIRGAVGRSRLVTLTGPGGVGKTRLAIVVARALESAFPDGVFLVPLSSLRDGRLLAGTVATALGLPEQATPAGV